MVWADCELDCGGNAATLLNGNLAIIAMIFSCLQANEIKNAPGTIPGAPCHRPKFGMCSSIVGPARIVKSGVGYF
jgi:hypothetical protein